jgi:hypothetical protein
MIMHINLNCLRSLGLVPHLIFQICDLGEEDEVPSRMTSIQEGDDDDGITTLGTTIHSIELHGPITRS